MLYYDTHTHLSNASQSGVVGIINCELGTLPPPTGYYSVGVHPANVGSVGAGLKQQLLAAARAENCVAIGECGIDKRYENIDAQQELFRVQVEVAKELAKPLIIHCVRAIGEVLKITKDFPYPRVLHAYHKRDQNLLGETSVYFSLGASNVEHSGDIPMEMVLLEKCRIEEVYNLFAEYRGVSLQVVMEMMERNFKNVFLAE